MPELERQTGRPEQELEPAPVLAGTTDSERWPPPVSADILCRIEKERRDAVKKMGPVPLGCREMDEQTLIVGGLERGAVVGISSEDEDFGILMGIQLATRAVCEGIKGGRHETAIVVTTQSPGAMARLLRDRAAGQINELQLSGTTALDVLSRVQIVQAFDLQGVQEVVDDLQREAAPKEMESHSGRPMKPPPRDEIPDSEDGSSPLSLSAEEDAKPSPSAQHDAEDVEQDTSDNARLYPSVILITQFFALLTTLFTQTEKSDAHASLQFLSSQIRHLTRSLPSNPLVILANTTSNSGSTFNNASSSRDPRAAPTPVSGPESDSTNPITPNAETTPHPPPPHGGHGGNWQQPDPTLVSIFNRAAPATTPFGHATAASRRKSNKPSFGLVFTQFLDLHLLCSRIPRDKADAETEALLGGGGRGRRVWVVEVLLDEMGLWDGAVGGRAGREERWGVVDVVRGRIVDAKIGGG